MSKMEMVHVYENWVRYCSHGDGMSTYQVNRSPPEPGHCQSEGGSVYKTPASVGQINQVLRSVIGDTDVIEDASQEVPGKGMVSR